MKFHSWGALQTDRIWAVSGLSGSGCFGRKSGHSSHENVLSAYGPKVGRSVRLV